MLPKDWYKKIIDINENQLMDDDILWADIFNVKFYHNITFMNMIEEESYGNYFRT
jgi:hypothetical protein